MRFEIEVGGAALAFRRDILLSRLTVLFMLVMAIRPFWLHRAWKIRRERMWTFSRCS